MSRANNARSWRYSPLKKSYPSMPMVMEFRCALRQWSFVGRGSLEHAGWLVISMNNWPSISSGKIVYRIVVRVLVGSIFFRRLSVYRLIDPGSEWRLHRLWFDTSAMGDLLGEDYSLVEKNALYRCLDKVLEHKQALFTHLTERWRGLLGAKFDVLLYDLTSTYFESSKPADAKDKRRYGYSRDKRSDCVQVVIALVITPEGFPLAYEVLAGNTSDRTTLREFSNKIETQYGKAERIWVMDRGIPTEEVL